ncbi:MAG: patatin-like phospholipase family protein [Proteobacteria bacterium]|nr:patatin-like phospholipase family protein [Pseudomonadota bacterium]MBU1639378.1 patatin-like phospholipase family protein [Pseudomonadota bacterium]
MDVHDSPLLTVIDHEKFKLVKSKELAVINERRKRLGLPPCHNDQQSSCDNLIGLALSGGGIRSATTNIGVLQGLSEKRVLPLVDYLSTVSGGGYIGACLSSLFSGTNKEAQFSTQWEHFPFREERMESGKEEPFDKYGQAQMHHMRVRASYLAPRALHFSSNVMRAIGAVFLSTFMSLLWFALIVTLITSLYMMVVSSVAPQLGSPQDKSTRVNQIEAVSQKKNGEVEYPKESPGVFSKKSYEETGREIAAYMAFPFTQFKNLSRSWYWGTIVVFFCLGVVFTYLRRRYFFKQESCGREESVSYKSFVYRIIFWLIIALYAGTFGAVLWDVKEFRYGAILVVPTLFVMGALLGFWFFYSYYALKRETWHRQGRSKSHVCAGILLATLFFALILAVLPGFMTIGVGKYSILILVAIGTGLRYFIASQGKISSEKTTFTLPSKYREGLLGLTTGLFLFLAVLFVGNFLAEVLFDGKWPGRLDDYEQLWLMGVFLVTALVLGGFNWLVDVNKISSHYFYRDRLAEMFLCTISHDESWKRDNLEMKLSEVHGDVGEDDKCWDCGPYLLLNATLNLTASKNLKAFNRKSDIFTFSRLYVGSQETGYIQTEDYMVDGGPLKLARVMTISGAAVTSVMGMNTSLVTSFLCTIFGVRLGYWLPNFKNQEVKETLGEVLVQERVLDAIKKGEQKVVTLTPTVPDLRGFDKTDTYECEKNINKLRKKIVHSATERMSQELVGYTTSDNKEIYLSDGGHSGDNLGIIPLLRRRVRVLIVSDSECDPEHSFDSFNSSVRNAYVDEGIKVKISLAGLRKKDEKGFTVDKLAVGEIVYPEQDEKNDPPNWIILYKNTMNGKEISPILNYKQKNSDFPHETTADQFFTEEQFESYRALGRYGIKEALESKDKWLKACSASDRKSSGEAYVFLRKMIDS